MIPYKNKAKVTRKKSHGRIVFLLVFKKQKNKSKKKIKPKEGERRFSRKKYT